MKQRKPAASPFDAVLERFEKEAPLAVIGDPRPAALHPVARLPVVQKSSARPVAARRSLNPAVACSMTVSSSVPRAAACGSNDSKGLSNMGEGLRLCVGSTSAFAGAAQRWCAHCR